MNASKNRARGALIFASIMLASLVFGLSTGGSQMAGAASPASTASAPSAPNETWQNPVNVSNAQGVYDNDPAVGGSALNDGATVAEESRDEGTQHAFGRIVNHSNSVLGLANFLGARNLEESGWKQNGSPRVAHDGLGRRHVIWWQADSNGTCGWYARVDADGVARSIQIVPNSCGGRKNTALAVAPDGTVHAFFGANLSDIHYWRMEPTGVWSIQNETVPNTNAPKDISAGVTSTNSPFIAWAGPGPVHSADVQVSMRGASGWVGPSNLSAPFCQGSAATAHLPTLAGDPTGGMRAAWTQVNCGQGLGTDDVFYREWTPSGWSGVIKQVTNSSSNSYNVTVAVDASGVAHLIWSDDQGFSTSNFKIWYSKGQGTDFSAPVRLFSGFFPDNAYEKDSSLDGGFSAMHLVLSTNLGESSPNKETYYSYAMTVPGSTPTPAVTPTPCIPGNFSDVRSTDFFYNAVRDLALHNVMSGYGDCTFRPSNNLTRGQAAKIVVTGSNVPPYTPATPTFRDVAVTDPFYQYVEAAYHSGVISGYTCGTGCLEFRSGFNVTRGQFAKMIKGAFALPTFTPATPTFRDVPRTDPFFADIETVVHNGIVSGYSCGTNCLEFRPGNLITRGQAAKMVYLARAVAVAEATATATAAATDTPIVVTATPTATLFVITATPTNTAVVVTSTPTITSTPSNTPTSTWTAMPTLTPTRTPTP